MYTPPPPLLLSQETDRGNLCILQEGTEGTRWRKEEKKKTQLHHDRKTFSLEERKGWLFSNCCPTIANLIRDPKA